MFVTKKKFEALKKQVQQLELCLVNLSYKVSQNDKRLDAALRKPVDKFYDLLGSVYARTTIKTYYSTFGLKTTEAWKTYLEKAVTSKYTKTDKAYKALDIINKELSGD